MSSEHFLHIMCPHLTCRTVLTVPVEARGKVVKCSKCGRATRVPTLEELAQAAAAAATPSAADSKG